MNERPSYIGTGRKYIRYSKAEIDEGRDTDMIEFLGRTKGFDFKRVGNVYVCNQHDSLVIQGDRHRWCWNSQNELGLSVYDWLEKIEGMSFTEACTIIIGNNRNEATAFTKVTSAVSNGSEKEQKVLSPPEKAENADRVKAYLSQTRCIDLHIVNYCVKYDLIYQDNQYSNAVFAGYDEDHVMRFAESKSTNTFKSYRPRNVSGSDKKYSFNLSDLNEQSEKDRLYVFEAPVDLLSHATMVQISENNRAKVEGRKADVNVWKRQNRLSLSGCSDVALESYLKRHPHISKLELCLDNDDAGMNACESIIAKYGDTYDIHVHRVKGGKDYNEALQNYVAELKARQQIYGTVDNSDTAVTINNTTQRKR
ncbi:MAG: DUF3991 and TOPRIM domain-containing protein [Ruminococcus sp.]|nr:DUF3991 and TOPRIM domain-containing protein [Ruminococcus sp.]